MSMNGSGDVPEGSTGQSTSGKEEDSTSASTPTNKESRRGSMRFQSEVPLASTFEAFIREAYGGRHKRLKATQASFSAMAAGQRPDDLLYADLLKLAASDRTLEKTRDFLIFLMGNTNLGSAGGFLRDFAKSALLQHPVFLTDDMSGVLKNLPDAVEESTAVRALSSLDYAKLSWNPGEASPKKRELEQCRRNVIACLLLWFRETRSVPLERLQSYLFSALWEPESRRKKSEIERFRILLQAKDRKALGVACSTLDRRVQDSTRDALSARDRIARFEESDRELRKSLSDLDDLLKWEKEEVLRLNGAIADARRDHENEMAHMRDDAEEMRGNMLRRLKQEVSLLDDGLHALRQTPPKVHVMLDHAERAMDGLKAEIERLKGER